MTGVGMLQRQKGVAIWRQIADRIRANVSAGTYDQTGALPSEMQLATEFSVNRHTVRAAIAALSDEGLLLVEKGKGTRIARKDRFDFPISPRTRFTAGLADQAQQFSGELLRECMEQADAEVATYLGLSVGADVCRLETRRSADGQAVGRSTTWLPGQRFAGFADAFRRKQSITKAFLDFGVTDYLRKSTEVSAVHADQEDLDFLGLTPGAIMLVTRSLNTDLADQPIQYSITRFPADRVQFSIRF
ncbi:phosphonate metabolism transcriptional regulator PhnF [Rhizobium lemnae]|uniref:Phosphonate metabolism transcriptional regulator PhnF n=1 Tax=Rhizobium lemnae TaxID=1214924 RepID=A0ABV8ED88_9HYPH|nr:phosphonate metabolism transcriptional regulator PhnF [Rhizobium lemnae]MCJ8507815.1 phosphonate metabolism transcriptional regulator PhnF [Rhizobium lemnae]